MALTLDSVLHVAPLSSPMHHCGFQCRTYISRSIASRHVLRTKWPSLTTLQITRSSSTSKDDDECNADTLQDGRPEGNWNPPPLPSIKLQEKRTVVIKGWSPFRNMAEVLAVVRAVERKFGPFIEYQAVRDYEMPDKYFGLIFAAFENPHSLKAVPVSGLEMTAPIPPGAIDKPGGVGWNDIEKLLEPQAASHSRPKRPSVVDSKKLRKRPTEIYFRVIPSRKELESPAPSTSNATPQTERENAINFLAWGQTLKLKPIHCNTNITDEVLFENRGLDNIRLRAALRYASQALGVQTPHEICPEDDPRKPFEPDPEVLSAMQSLSDYTFSQDPLLQKVTVEGLESLSEGSGPTSEVQVPKPKPPPAMTLKQIFESKRTGSTS